MAGFADAFSAENIGNLMNDPRMLLGLQMLAQSGPQQGNPGFGQRLGTAGMNTVQQMQQAQHSQQLNAYRQQMAQLQAQQMQMAQAKAQAQQLCVANVVRVGRFNHPPTHRSIGRPVGAFIHSINYLPAHSPHTSITQASLRSTDRRRPSFQTPQPAAGGGFRHHSPTTHKTRDLMLAGKRCLVVGVANHRSIAWGVAQVRRSTCCRRRGSN